MSSRPATAPPRAGFGLPAVFAASLLACSPGASAPAAGTSSPAPLPASAAPPPAPASAAPVAPTAPADGASQRVADLVAHHPTKGTFTITGYVIKSYACPPCPKGAECKPCMGDNVVVSDAERRIASYSEMGPGDAIVFVGANDLAGLQLGRRYTLRVEVRPGRSTSGPMNDLQLVKADPAP